MSVVKESQLIFSPQMIRAILERRKTQARISITPHPATNKAGKPYWRTVHNTPQLVGLNACPLGKVGDYLLVREAFTAMGLAGPETYYRASPLDHAPDYDTVRACGERKSLWLTLEVADIRIDRLHNISIADCHAEGFAPHAAQASEPDHNQALIWYRRYWDNECGNGDWSTNPWVWVVDFAYRNGNA